MLYAEISKKQQEHWRVAAGFVYEDIRDKEHFLAYPGHIEGTYYSVYYVKNVTAIH
jgi:hypothetical protein